jgi:WD40 repeat protein
MQMAVAHCVAIIGSNFGDLFYYDLTKLKFIKNIPAHSNPLICIGLKQSLGLMATGDSKGEVKLWSPSHL